MNMYGLVLDSRKKDREELFVNTAARKGLDKAIIEKDFWVCFSLDYLFNKSPWKDRIAFKGGTSLSKVYNQIQRFSEDFWLMLLTSRCISTLEAGQSMTRLA